MTTMFDKGGAYSSRSQVSNGVDLHYEGCEFDSRPGRCFSIIIVAAGDTEIIANQISVNVETL